MENTTNPKGSINTVETNIKSSHSVRFYLNLIVRNKIPLTLSLLVGLIVSYFYAYSQVDIYGSASSMKLSKPSENVLDNKIFSDIEAELPERFISNEVEILKSAAIREKTARSLVDSFKVLKGQVAFSDLCASPSNCNDPKSVNQISGILSSNVEISQKRGLDILSIRAESPSPQEAALMANCYAEAYADYSLKFNRGHLTLNRDFLEKQVKEKYDELMKSEEKLTNFFRSENIADINAQASSVIGSMATIQTQYDASLIEVQTSDKAYQDLKNELNKQDPEATKYFESMVTDPYVKQLQEEISKLEIQRDLAQTGNEELLKDSKNLKEINTKITGLKKTLDSKLGILKNNATANTPEQRREMALKLFDANLMNNQNKIRENLLKGFLETYKTQYNKLPEQKIEFENLQREKDANERIYLMLLEKYQEALINEESTPNNVKIIDYGKPPKAPSRPNRLLIIVIGLLVGAALGYVFALLRSILDVSIKSPEELENVGISLIGWVPTFMNISRGGRSQPSEQELIIAYNADSAPAESFRTLRTRLQFAKLEPEPIKTILITSSIPREGKTIISANLAASFALSNKVLLIDCDFRKPRLHNLFNQQRYPGLCDYLFGTVSIEEIERKTSFENLTLITCGTVPTNPAELIASKHMQSYLNSMRPKFDYIIIDSPPLATVTDAELLSSYADGTVLVSLANKTRLDLLINTIETLNKINDTFIGVILNNFDYQATYGSYYKYYYYYYGSQKGKTTTTTGGGLSNVVKDSKSSLKP